VDLHSKFAWRTSVDDEPEPQAVAKACARFLRIIGAPEKKRKPRLSMYIDIPHRVTLVKIPAVEAALHSGTADDRDLLRLTVDGPETIDWDTRNALRTLTSGDREVVLLRNAGYSLREIAGITGAGENGEQRVWRRLKRIREVVVQQIAA
jgi:DNA-directed RNA polymerase specialized sigma24 family protein